MALQHHVVAAHLKSDSLDGGGDGKKNCSSIANQQSGRSGEKKAMRLVSVHVVGRSEAVRGGAVGALARALN